LAFGGQINGAAASAATGNDDTNGGSFGLHDSSVAYLHHHDDSDRLVHTVNPHWSDFFGVGWLAAPNDGGNAPIFRMRHPWGCLGPVCAGQTWSTFIPVWAGAETLDFGGGYSAIFVRHAQIRFIHSFGGGWILQLAIEDLNGGAIVGSGGGDALAARTVGGGTAAPVLSSRQLVVRRSSGLTLL
jgi:hypothetical protein